MSANSTTGTTAKQEKVERLATLCDLLGNSARIQILGATRKAEVAVGALSELTGVSTSGISQHLAKMKAHGLVTGRRDAQTVYYRLVPGALAELKSLLAEIVG